MRQCDHLVERGRETSGKCRERHSVCRCWCFFCTHTAHILNNTTTTRLPALLQRRPPHNVSHDCQLHSFTLHTRLHIHSTHLGYPPFFSDDPLTTCRKIVNWRLFLKFPDEIKISPTAHDLISRLMCDVDERLGTNGVQVCG